MATMYSRNVAGDSRPHFSSQNSNSSSHSVHFGAHQNRDEYNEERKKYLTAKYGQHQMKLIRKRLAVEDWVDTQLRKLYEVEEASDTYDCEIDLDELLDLDKDTDKRQFVQDKVANARKSPETINKFIDEILEKAHTL